MKTLRALIREDRHFAMALILLAFAIKAAIPAGFMISAAPGQVMTVTICSQSSGFQTVDISVPTEKSPADSHSDGAKKDNHCAFSGLTQAAMGGADALLLALALAYILLLGFAPGERAPLRRPSYLRPPLRGPPATA